MDSITAESHRKEIGTRCRLQANVCLWIWKIWKELTGQPAVCAQPPPPPCAQRPVTFRHIIGPRLLDNV